MWFTIFFMWTVLPMQSAFLASGRVGVADRVKDALRIKSRFYVYATIFSLAAAVATFLEKGLSAVGDLPALVALMSNSFGAALLSVFCGYGAAALPRATWRRASRALSLENAQLAALKYHYLTSDCEVEIRVLLAQVYAIEGELPTQGRGHGAAQAAPHERKLVGAIEAMCPREQVESARQRHSGSPERGGKSKKGARMIGKVIP